MEKKIEIVSKLNCSYRVRTTTVLGRPAARETNSELQECE